MEAREHRGNAFRGAADLGRSLRIAQIAPPWVSVPPATYGGTEVVIDQLSRALAARHHDVLLFATGDSTCPVPRRSLYEHELGTTGPTLAEIRQALWAHGAARDVDVIHDHTLVGPLLAAHGDGPPVVTTVHAGLTPEIREVYRAMPDRVTVVAISTAQRVALRAAGITVDRVILHGIDVEMFRPGSGAGGYALFLGRMAPTKGAHRAIRVARAAGVPLLLAAKIWEPEERTYFEETVEPLLGPDARYLGEVGGRRKAELLSGAVALLNPIRWSEPFGLVMAEALACGTPVLAFAEGSAPEIVHDGVTGFLCEDEDDMSARLRDVAKLDRGRCRAEAVERFSTDRMASDYLALYRSVTCAPSRLVASA